MADSSSPGIRPSRLDALLEHGKADEAVSTHAHRTREFRRVVNRDSDQVVGADRLGWKVGSLHLRCGGLRLCRRDGQWAGDAGKDQNQRWMFTLWQCFWHCSILR